MDVGRSFGETFADADPNANTDGRGVSFGEPERKYVGHRECVGQSKCIAFRDRGGFAASLMALGLQRARGRAEARPYRSWTSPNRR